MIQPLDPALERWRLILGRPAHGLAPSGLTGAAARRDAALDWLYRRDEGLARRGVRHSGPRDAGSDPSALTVIDWLDSIHRLFPRETITRLERDAVERYGLVEIVTDPSVLERVEPSPALLRAVLLTKHLMDQRVLRLARHLVAQVVRELMERLATEVRMAFSGPRLRRRSRTRLARNFDFRRTIHSNLANYRPEQRRLYVETPYFQSRSRREIERWQVILVVDQSGSMAGSVIHAAVTAACLWGLPGIRTHLIAFDTNVIDLTSEVDDPVELLMKVQLGGGTDIASAVAYAAGLIEQPRRTVLAVVSDFFEGGDAASLVRLVRELTAQGTRVLGLAALDEEANPDYHHALAQELADAGAHVGAMTPGHLAAFVAECMG